MSAARSKVVDYPGIGKVRMYPIKSKPFSRSGKAGLNFPVGRVHKALKRGKYAERLSSVVPVYVTAVLEYLMAELLELSGDKAHADKKSRITPRHIQLAINTDDELRELCQSVVISGGGKKPSEPPTLVAPTEKITYVPPAKFYF